MTNWDIKAFVPLPSFRAPRRVRTHAAMRHTAWACDVHLTRACVFQADRGNGACEPEMTEANTTGRRTLAHPDRVTGTSPGTELCLSLSEALMHTLTTMKQNPVIFNRYSLYFVAATLREGTQARPRNQQMMNPNSRPNLQQRKHFFLSSQKNAS